MESRPKIIAHRGASGNAPQNSLTAVLKAIEMGADAIEFDVRQTKDGHMVLMHNRSAARTTGVRRRIEDMTLDEVRELDAGDGNPPPSLPDMLELLAKHNADLPPGQKLKFFVESKCPGIDMVGKDLELARKNHGLSLDDVIITSHQRKKLVEFKKQHPDMQIGLLNGRFTKASLNRAKQDGFSCAYTFCRLIDDDVIAHAHTIGMSVCAGGVNSGPMAAWTLRHAGQADYISTNHVANAQYFLRHYELGADPMDKWKSFAERVGNSVVRNLPLSGRTAPFVQRYMERGNGGKAAAQL